MVSIRDIARECGVAVSTVSKALNGQADVSQETREKVCAAAERMGYMANSAARALKTNRSYNLGVLFADESNCGLTHEYFAHVLESVKAEAEARGYDITFINGNVGDKPTSYLQHCRYRGVDGVVIACVDFRDPRVQELVDDRIPVVTIDYIFNDRLAVVSDNVSGMEQLVRYIYSRGHRRIAYLHGQDNPVTRSRLTGFYRACEALDLHIPPQYIVPSTYYTPERCRIDTRRLLQLDPRPTCIIFPDDFSYMGAMDALAEAGLRVPEDISVAGYDGISLARVLHLTTYSQDTRILGQTAARQLISLIERPKTTVTDRILVRGHLVEGSTVRDISKEPNH
ncbi:MAG: LacI family DNA-binding transcriptional regulator [Eubacteriales bacterium]|nr:LacI family DNA-binding transcriptional regulator [Eubacteriales bacterium]